MSFTDNTSATTQSETSDLDHNRRGSLSDAQVALLRQQRLVAVAGAAAFSLVGAALLAALYLKLSDPTFAGRGTFFLGLALGLFWLWLLRGARPRWWRLNRDLRERQVHFVDGPIHPDPQPGLGVIQVMNYAIRVGKDRFRVSQSTFFELENGRSYRVYYSAHARVFLGAEPLPGLNTDLASQAPAAQPAAGSPLAEPLTQREIEILRLIAAGRSNQEIADTLFLSINTIKMYTSQLYQKLGVRRRTEAVGRARELGLL